MNSDFSGFWRGVTAFLAVMGACVLDASAAELGAQAIVEKAIARARQTEASPAKTGVSYTKVAVREELDSSGHVKERKEKVYEVAFRDGSTFVKLATVNGHAPAASDLKQQAENESSARQMLGESKSDKGGVADRQASFLTPELVSRFDFALAGTNDLNGRRTYLLAFKPKSPAAPIHKMVDHVLNRVSGTLWIDAQEFEMARADIRLGSEVDLLGGVIGCLKKMAFTLQRTRVADGLWLNTDMAGDFEGRKLLESMRVKTHSQCLNIRKG
jgi:hypothetical protein